MASMRRLRSSNGSIGYEPESLNDAEGQHGHRRQCTSVSNIAKRHNRAARRIFGSRNRHIAGASERKLPPKFQRRQAPGRRFQAYFYSEADWARTTIEAATPERALQRARQIESEEIETLDFKSYDSGAGVEHIEILSAEGDMAAEWRHEDLLLRTAARELRDVLQEQTEAAQGVIDRWSSGDLAAAVRIFAGLIETARTVIAKTKPAAA